MKVDLLVARFPYRPEEPELVDWLMGLEPACVRDGRVGRFDVAKFADTPITMTRNAAAMEALRGGYDYLLMVDNDVAPDCERGEDPLAEPFWPVALDFAINHRGPCVVGAPYCGPPPEELPYVFRWQNRETGSANPSESLQMYTREEAAAMSGVQEVAALPTGLILFDVRAFKALPPPWFTYQYRGDGPECPACGFDVPRLQAQKASTEDVVVTRDLSILGVRQYCAWDSWAGHVKRKVVRRPRPVTPDAVARRLRETVRSGALLSTERRGYVRRRPGLPRVPPLGSEPPIDLGLASLTLPNGSPEVDG